MITAIGIGDFCCKIVDKLSVYPQYSIYQISTSVQEDEKTKKLPKLKNAEQYEEKTQLDGFIKDKSKQAIVFLDGSENISGITLKLLQTIADKKITIFYIQSDLSLGSQTEKLQNKICINILQEYARSGMFEKIVLLDKHMIENTIGEMPVKEYSQKMSEYIAHVVHMNNVYSNIEPIMSNSVDVHDTSRIVTYGIGVVNSDKINWFFNLQNKEYITYYFAINKNLIEKDKKLLQNIKKQIKAQQTEETQISFSIFETSYQENYVFCAAATKFVQTETSA